jgi:hypothetical protein
MNSDVGIDRNEKGLPCKPISIARQLPKRRMLRAQKTMGYGRSRGWRRRERENRSGYFVTSKINSVGYTDRLEMRLVCKLIYVIRDLLGIEIERQSDGSLFIHQG